MKKSTKYKNLTGEKFGRLVCVKDVGRAKQGSVLWECKCDCGNVTVVTSRNLIHNNTKSCGCLQKDKIIENRTVHGLYYDENGKRAKLYHVWGMIRQRCNNPNNHAYKDYGGRGISVCKEWDAYKEFHNWALEKGYEEGLTIERVNNDGNYEPNNCEWIPKNHQQRNRRNNVYLMLNGKNQTLAEWGEELGVNPKILGTRKRRGWTDERILNQPIRRVPRDEVKTK